MKRSSWTMPASMFLLTALASPCLLAQPSVARQWNEELLEAIRNDLARPTVHARNLFHLAGAMYDAWAAFDPTATGYLVTEKAVSQSPEAARDEAISYAAYGLLQWRFVSSVGADIALPRFDALMDDLGYDRLVQTAAGSSPAALGNRIADVYINFGLADGANEADDYGNRD